MMKYVLTLLFHDAIFKCEKSNHVTFKRVSERRMCDRNASDDHSRDVCYDLNRFMNNTMIMTTPTRTDTRTEKRRRISMTIQDFSEDRRGTTDNTIFQ